jgi:hypothetical protein
LDHLVGEGGGGELGDKALQDGLPHLLHLQAVWG